MNVDLGSSHITKPGDNIFQDLGFAKDEADKLQADSRSRINAKLAMKKELMLIISDWMKQENLKQEDAAKILMVSRPRVSDVVKQKTVKFTVDTLIDMVMKTGRKAILSI